MPITVKELLGPRESSGAVKMPRQGSASEFVYARLDRADTYLNQLRTALEGFFQGNPYKIVLEHEPDSWKYVFRIEILKSPPPELGFLVGEYAFHLRSAVDNLLWQIAGTFQDPPDDHIMFPVTLNDHDFRSAAGRRLKGIPKNIRDQIEELQPYKRTNPPERDPLWVLDRLFNIDKHRTMHVLFFSTYPYATLTVDGFEGAPDGAILDVEEFNINRPLKNGDVIVAFRPRWQGEPQFKGNIAINVCLDESTPLPGVVLGNALTDLRIHVRQVVFPALETFLA